MSLFLILVKPAMPNSSSGQQKTLARGGGPHVCKKNKNIFTITAVRVVFPLK